MLFLLIRASSFTVIAIAFLAISCKIIEKSAKPAVAVETPKTVPVFQATGYLFPFINETNKWGYLDVNGDVAIEPAFDFADGFSDGFARVRLGDQWGYVDVFGKIAIKPQFERARDFVKGTAAVRFNRKYGYINKTGKFIVEPQFSKLAQSFAEGLGAVPDSTKKFGYVNMQGTLVIPHKFDNAYEFSEGLAAVEQDRKWGFIDTTGNWFIGPQYVWADKFVDGIALVRNGTQPNVRYSIIDRNNNLLYSFQTPHANTPSEGLIRFELNGKWGFWDRTGKWVIPPTYDAAFDFSEGLAPVRVGNGWGYIDLANNVEINVEYSVAEEFHGGLARVTWPGGKWGYIDQTGRIIWQSKIPGSFAGSSDDSETES